MTICYYFNWQITKIVFITTSLKDLSQKRLLTYVNQLNNVNTILNVFYDLEV